MVAAVRHVGHFTIKFSKKSKLAKSMTVFFVISAKIDVDQIEIEVVVIIAAVFQSCVPF